MGSLFDIAPQEKTNTATCRTCVHRERWECGSKVIQYCGIRTSKRTDNGKLKIKAKDQACGQYEWEG